MKKVLLSIAFVLAVIFVSAQDNTLEILGHDFSTDYQGHDIPIYKVQSMVEKPDGNIVMANLFRRRFYPGSSTMVNVGYGFYSISRQELAVADSTFLESNLEYNEDNNAVLLVHDPVGEGYVFVKFVSDRISYPGWDGFTWLEIFHSDEDLNFNPEPVIVPLEEAHIGSPNGIMLEGEENLVVRYVLDGVPVLARIGLDGRRKSLIRLTGTTAKC